MKIGIDCRTILNPDKGEKAGIGYYTYYLVKNLLKLDNQNSYVLFFDSSVSDVRAFQKKNVKIKFLPFSQYGKYLPFAYSHLLIAAVMGKEKLDIYHSPANPIPYMYTGPSVITIHDLSIYKYPAWFPKVKKIRTKPMIFKSLHRAQKIIAVSYATKKDIIKLFKIPTSKIEVIYQGIAKERIPGSKEKSDFRKRFKIKNKYIFYIGTIESRKNLVSLIEAYHHLITDKNFKDYPLVLAGAKGHHSKKVFNKIKELKLERKVKYLGYVSHNDKISLMKGAEIFVFPTLYEGFGRPVLEAMSLGTPVITSKVSSVPEVAGKAALLINPNKVSAITQAMKKVLSSSSLRERIIKSGLIQSRKFSWIQCAEKTLELYRKVAEKTGRKKRK